MVNIKILHLIPGKLKWLVPKYYISFFGELKWLLPESYISFLEELKWFIPKS